MICSFSFDFTILGRGQRYKGRPFMLKNPQTNRYDFLVLKVGFKDNIEKRNDLILEGERDGEEAGSARAEKRKLEAEGTEGSAKKGKTGKDTQNTGEAGKGKGSTGKGANGRGGKNGTGKDGKGAGTAGQGSRGGHGSSKAARASGSGGKNVEDEEESNEITLQQAMNTANADKKRMMLLLSQASKLVQKIQSDPQWQWAEPLLKPLWEAKAVVDEIKFSNEFLSKWAMDQNWLRTARKNLEKRASWAGLEAVNGLVEKLEILDDEVRTLNDMQEARVKNQNRNKA